MTFTSLVFFYVFFPLCLLAYYGCEAIGMKCGWIVRYRIKDIILVFASLGFYSYAGLSGGFFLVLYILAVYAAGKIIEYCAGKNQRKCLCFCLFLLVMVLIVYKYTNFLLRIVGRLGLPVGGEINIMAPLGISFITFSAVSYLSDVYRKDANAGNILDVALFLTFFPKIISGPIQLWKDFQRQTNPGGGIPASEAIIANINRIAAGMAKKVILADTFGNVVADIQGNAGYGIDSLTAWGAALLYMLQIYYDFSGYSDMAIGLAGLFGVQIKENFNFPYISQSVSEFWRRWHISLGTWFRQYIYIPLGGNRKGFCRTLFNLFVVFLLTGIWHGAGWNYILWGIMNGVCVVGERCVKDKKWYRKTPGAIKWMATMFFVFISWQIFRLPYLSDIRQYLGIMAGIVRFGAVDLTWRYFFEFKILVLMIAGILGATVLSSPKIKKMASAVNQSTILYIVQEILVLLCAAVSIMCMVNSTYSPFLYFQY